MQPDPVVETPTPAPLSQARLTQLVQEASGLQTLCHKFMLLLVTSRFLSCDSVASPLQVRQALRDLMAAWSRLRNVNNNLLAGGAPAMIQIMAQAFSRENETVFKNFEEMAHAMCVSLSKGVVPAPADLTELVHIASTDLAAANLSIATAAQVIANTARDDPNSQALVDLVTGLPNRRALQDMLRHNELIGWPQNDVAILHIDLDKLKKINDTFGRAAGDAALQHATKVLSAKTHADEFLACLGGDEFVLVLFGATSQETLAHRAETLIKDVSEPFRYEGKRYHVSGCVGIALGARADGISLDTYLINADLALGNAKHAGRGTYRFFTPVLRIQSQQKENLAGQIRDGLEAEQFEPFFQPQVEGRSGKLVGFEALARWHHPTRGLLVPGQFLDAAHSAGLLEHLDQYLMERTFANMRSWINDGLQIPQVSINLTAARLLEVDLVNALLFAVDKADLHASMVGIEILETAMIDDASQQLSDNIAGLADAGFKLELDDFGTGHASISNLRNFKVDRIKIDRSFIKDVHLYPDLSKITAAMIGLAHSLRVDALAEGVETPEERLVLNALGCDHFQGYGVSRPMPASDVPAWIRRTQQSKSLPPRRN